MKKMINDRFDDRRGQARTSMANYVKTYLLDQFGMRKLAEAKHQSLVNGILRFSKTNFRIRLFGIITGVWDGQRYSQKISDVVLDVIGK
jgi:hypothetical protein